MLGSTTVANRLYFDSRAEIWEEERQRYYSDRIRDVLVERGGFAGEDTVLDYGAGSGYVTEALLAAGVGRIIAVDLSAKMLRELGHRHGPRVEQRLADDERIPLAVGEVTGVVANMVLHHLEKPSRFFQEACRVLRPGGRVVITDLVTYEAADLTEDQHDRWPGFEPTEVEGWLRAAGLGRIRSGLVGERCCAGIQAAKGGAEIFYALGVKEHSS